MSKRPALVKSERRSDSPAVNQALAYHFAAESAAHQAAGYAALCGLTLKVLKKEAGHGDWELFRANRFGDVLSDRLASKYMLVAEGLKVKAKDQPALLVLLKSPAHRLAKAKRERLAAMVRDLCDGETMASLIAAYRITRRPAGSAAPGGYRPDEARVQAFLGEVHPTLAGTPYAALSPEVQAAFRAWLGRPETTQLQLALDEWQPILRHLDEKAPARTWMHLPHGDLRRLHDAMDAQVREMAAALRDARA